MTAQNQGECEETFDIALYANASQINQVQITLAGEDSADIAFNWNTTDFPKGNYPISAEAAPLPAEMDTEDNAHTNGMVLVTIAGDVNGDGSVHACGATAPATVFLSCMHTRILDLLSNTVYNKQSTQTPEQKWQAFNKRLR